jgi:hypothetical protein
LAYIAAGAAVMLLLGAGAAVLFLNRIIAANHSALVAQMERVVGRPVQLAGIRVRFGLGLGLAATDIVIADEPGFDGEPFLRARAVTARVEMLPLLQRRLAIDRIVVTAPVIRLVRGSDGRWNYGGLGHPAQAGVAHSIVQVRTEPAVEPPAPLASARIALVVQSAAIVDGAVRIIDRTRSPATQTDLRDVDLELRDLSRDQPIAFELAATAMGAARNVVLSGTVGPLSQTERVPLSVAGQLGPFAAFQAVVDQLDGRALLTANAISVEHLSGRTCSGTFAAAGAVPWHAGGAWSLTGNAERLVVAELLKAAAPEARSVSGTAALRFDLGGTTGENAAATVAGTARIEIADGRVHDLNLVNEVLGRVTGIRGVEHLLSERIKPKYARLFDSADTLFERMTATIRVAEQRVAADDLTITAEDFGVTALGWIDFGRRIDLQGRLLMSSGFSADVVADVKAVRYILDRDGRLAVPFVLRGVWPNVSPKPNTDELIALLERALSRGAAGQFLDDLLGGKKRRDGERKSDSVEQRLRDLFGR